MKFEVVLNSSQFNQVLCKKKEERCFSCFLLLKIMHYACAYLEVPSTKLKGKKMEK